MRISKIFTIALFAILLVLLPDFAEAKLSNNRRAPLNLGRSRSSYRSSGSGGGGGRRGSPTFYYGLVTIEAADGTYYTGYGDECPGGCAIDHTCRTEEECADLYK